MSDNGEELDRLRAELALLRYRFDLLVEHSSEAIYLKDLESRYTYVNEACARMMFQRPEALIGRNDEGLFTREVAAEIRADDLHVLRTGQTVVLRTLRTLTNGTHINFLTIKRPWFDADGRIIGIVGTTRDVTELADAQREAAAASESFRTLVETMAEVVLVHRGGLIRYANPAALGLLGRSEAEVVGAPLVEFVRPKDVEVFAGLAQGVESAEIGFVRAAGSVAIVQLSDVRGIWCGEEVRVAVGRDVSARLRLEARLQDSERLAAVGMVASSIAHEIKNPLTYVLGQVQGLLAAAPEGPQRARLVDLVDAVDRIGGIVSGVSALANPDSAAPSATDVEAALDRALLLAGTHLRDRAVVLRDRGGVPPALASERRLVQILLNLLVNAAQAMAGQPGEGRLRIQTWSVAGQVVVRVRDSGPGVPLALAPRLFEPFVSTKAPGEGTGLGLWLSRSLAVELGGSLELENPGAPGAAFLLRLPTAPGAVPTPDAPAAPRSIAEAPPAVEAAPPPVRPRLLLVDDERLISDLLVDGLAGHFDIVAVDGVEAALSTLERSPPFDLVLCDLIMPRGGGARLFDELGRRGRRPLMVFMSGGAATPEARHFVERERITPIEKPFRIGDVRRRLLAALGQTTNPGDA